MGHRFSIPELVDEAAWGEVTVIPIIGLRANVVEDQVNNLGQR
jgi:hypothetical protein